MAFKDAPSRPGRILVVGSWAKEQISIENIKKNPRFKVFSYLDTKNPGILSIVDGYRLGDLQDIDSIVEYAESVSTDMLLATTASPLSLGLVDALEKKGIFAFGPVKEAAKLESDKAFTRKFMKKYNIPGLPEFSVFEDKKKASLYAESMNWNVAVKPAGLTEGLGVKVFGLQLKNKSDIVEYINEILGNKAESNSKVIIEEKLTGEEFTIQCLVNGNTIIPLRPVQDFKRLLPGGKGPNTASMGSYSVSGNLLPFMREKDYNNGLEIIKKTLSAFTTETGIRCRGFLYGQFMITDGGIKLVEYNFRPGDPEWINTLAVLKDNLIDIIMAVMNGRKIDLKIEPKATVCKYIVPRAYPRRLNQILDVEIPCDEIIKNGVNIYYSCGLQTDGRLNVGSERGIAFVSKADSVPEACKRVEQAISRVKGDFRYRKDIGTKKMIREKFEKLK